MMPASSNPVDCAVIVVTYNSAEHIEAFIDSVHAAADPLRIEVIVVDNDSQDRTAERASAFDGVTVIARAVNDGYSAGINAGRSVAGACKSILVTNPDVRFEPGSIAALHGSVMEDGVGVAVPALLDPDGRQRVSLRREPTIGRQLGEALFGDHLPNRPAWMSEIIRARSSYQAPCAADWATGAVLMVSEGCDRAVGDWNEDFFLFSEEVDYAHRVRDAGYSLAYVPSARVVHVEGGSGRQSSYTGLMAVNRLRYYRDRHGAAASMVYAATLLLEQILRVGRRDSRHAAVLLIRTAVPAIRDRRFPSGKRLALADASA